MIFFDIDDTLVDQSFAQQAAALAFQKEHIAVFPEPPDVFAKRWYSVAEKHFDRYFSGEISFQQQRRARLQEMFRHDRELTDADADSLFLSYLQDYEDNWRLFPDVMPCLTALEGYGLGIISNGDSEQQKQKLEMMEIDRCFSVVIISGDKGVAKPLPGIFIDACEQVGKSTEQCLHVGDSLEADAKGSSAAGMMGAW